MPLLVEKLVRIVESIFAKMAPISKCVPSKLLLPQDLAPLNPTTSRLLAARAYDPAPTLS